MPRKDKNEKKMYEGSQGEDSGVPFSQGPAGSRTDVCCKDCELSGLVYITFQET